jgi:hypothetical protein
MFELPATNGPEFSVTWKVDLSKLKTVLVPGKKPAPKGLPTVGMMPTKAEPRFVLMVGGARLFVFSRGSKLTESRVTRRN